MPKLFWIFSACMIFTTSLSAGWVEDRGDGTTVVHIKVYSLPMPADSSPPARANLEIHKRFVERFPGLFAERIKHKALANPELYGNHNWDRVEIKLHQATGIKVEGVESDLLQIAGDLAPDVLYVNFRKSDTYIRNNFLLPLDEYIDMMPKEEFEERVHKKILPVIKRFGPDGKEHVWSFPSGGLLGKVLLYRKNLFDKHGIPYPDKNFTWDMMLEACRKITEPEKGIYGMLLGRGKTESWFWVTFLWSAGGDAMVYNEETHEWRCAFDSMEAARALDFYTTLGAEKWEDGNGNIQRGYSSKDASENAYTKWDKGEIGMMFGYIDEDLFSKIDPDVTGMAPIPLSYAGTRGGEINCRMLGLYSRIKDKVVQDAAWEYINFINNDEALALRTRIMVENGMGRFVNPVYLEKYGYPEIVRLSPPGWSEIFEIAVETGQPEPYGKNSNVAYDFMSKPIQKAEQLAINDALPTDPDERLAVIKDLLEDANARANEQMMGKISSGERTKRRLTAVVFLIGVVIAFSFVFRKVIKAFTPPASDGELRKEKWGFVKYKYAYLILAPALLAILTWSYVPLLRGSYMAFFDYRLIGKSTFVGLDNFGDLIYDSLWWQSIWNALRYSLLVMSLTFMPPIILAILLQEVPHGKLLYRTIYYLPAVVTGLVTVLLWKQFYEPSTNGALNSILLHIPAVGFILFGLLLGGICLAFAMRLRLHALYIQTVIFGFVGLILLSFCWKFAIPILFPDGESLAVALSHIPSRLFATTPEAYRWLSNPETAMISCVMPMVWAGMGPGCLIYLAALKGIPNDYYEAADLDGASFIDKILFVVFPTLKALIIINFVGAFINSWYGATGNILVMTGGGANTEVAGLFIWYKAFTYLKFGPATAAAWMLAFMLIGFTVYKLRILSRVEFRAAGSKK